MATDAENMTRPLRGASGVVKPVSPLAIRLLCVGNGGVVRRDGRTWTHHAIAVFLRELGSTMQTTWFCAWLDPGEDPLAQDAIEEIPGVSAVVLPRFDGPTPQKWMQGLAAFATLVRVAIQSDFAYLYWPGRLSSVAARICRALGKPYGIYLRGEQIPPDPTQIKAFRNARFVLATGEPLKQAAAALCPDVECVTPMTSVSASDIRAPRPPRTEGPWRLLYVGRMEERKGTFDLLDSLPYLREWGVPCRVSLVGHCYDPIRMQRALRSAGAGQVELVGAVANFEELARYYLDADVLVVPSHDEGFPRVLYEAMTLGVPILTTFVGSVPTLMVDRHNCLRIEARDPRDIAAKLKELLAAPDLRRALAASASTDVRNAMSTWTRSHAMQVHERLRSLT